MNVVWMRQAGSRIAHAFAEIDLSAEFAEVEPVSSCDRFKIADLQRDELAERCRACARARREAR